MMLDVVRRFVEHRVPVLPVAGVAGHPEVPHAPATLVCFPRRRAETRLPSDLRHAGRATAGDRTGSTAACNRTWIRA